MDEESDRGRQGHRRAVGREVEEGDEPFAVPAHPVRADPGHAG